MSADADTGPVGTGHRVRPWVTVFNQGLQELVDKVGMGAPVSATLDKGEVVRIMDFLRHREPANRLGQQVGIVGHLDLLGNLRLGFLGRVDHVGFVLNQRPLETLLRPVDVETLPVLPGDIIQAAPDVSRDVTLLDLDVTRFHGKSIP